MLGVDSLVVVSLALSKVAVMELQDIPSSVSKAGVVVEAGDPSVDEDVEAGEDDTSESAEVTTVDDAPREEATTEDATSVEDGMPMDGETVSAEDFPSVDDEEDNSVADEVSRGK